MKKRKQSSKKGDKAFVKASKKSRSKLMLTTDDWFPTFEGNHVRVSLTFDMRRESLTPDAWRVQIWGADDMGMEIEVANYEEASALYEKLQEPITKLSLIHI